MMENERIRIENIRKSKEEAERRAEERIQKREQEERERCAAKRAQLEEELKFLQDLQAEIRGAKTKEQLAEEAKAQDHIFRLRKLIEADSARIAAADARRRARQLAQLQKVNIVRKAKGQAPLELDSDGKLSTTAIQSDERDGNGAGKDGEAASAKPSDPSPQVEEVPPSPPLFVDPKRGVGPPFMIKCMFAYDAEEPDEMTMAAGDIIAIHSRDSADWWIGLNETTNSQGLFPSDYVKRVAVQCKSQGGL